MKNTQNSNELTTKENKNFSSSSIYANKFDSSLQFDNDDPSDDYTDNNTPSIRSLKFEDKFDLITSKMNKLKLNKQSKDEEYQTVHRKRLLAEKKVQLLRDEINKINSKISEINISKQKIEKQNRLIEVFIQENKEEHENKDNIQEINEDIEDKCNQINVLANEIKTYAQYTFEITPEIDSIKKNIQKLKKKHRNLKEEYYKSKREKKNVFYEYLRIKKQLMSLERNSQNFLNKIDK